MCSRQGRFQVFMHKCAPILPSCSSWRSPPPPAMLAFHVLHSMSSSPPVVMPPKKDVPMSSSEKVSCMEGGTATPEQSFLQMHMALCASNAGHPSIPVEQAAAVVVHLSWRADAWCTHVTAGFDAESVDFLPAPGRGQEDQGQGERSQVQPRACGEEQSVG